MCNGIGLSQGQANREITKISEDEVLKEGYTKFGIPSNGGIQETLCLKLDYVPLWLAKISITPAMREEHPEVAATLVQYQLKAKDVLAAAFMPDLYGEGQTKTKAPLQPESAGGVAQLLKVLRATMKDNDQPSEVIAQTIKDLCEHFGLKLPANFVRRAPFQQMTLWGLVVSGC